MFINKKALVVDDEEHIVELIEFNLQQNGFQVIKSYSGEDGVKLAGSEKPDIVILDIMLPGMDGYEVCKCIRKNDETKDIPIIMLTVKKQELDKVIGLELGADDYMTKPFGVRELLARIKAVLRRNQGKDSFGKESEIIAVGDIVLNCKKYEVKKNEKTLDLTLTEFKLLEILLKNKGIVLSRQYLVDEIWNGEVNTKSRALDVHIRKLRKKIEDNDKFPKYIETVRGVGYKI